MTTGYLREKDDIKYFILFAMSQLPFPVGEPDLLDICLIDDAFGIFRGLCRAAKHRPCAPPGG